MVQWLTNPTAPAWVQAIGSVVAILVAVFVPWFQRRNVVRDAARERVLQDQEHLKRLTIGLREEIRAASDAARRRQEAIATMFDELKKAQAAGAKLKESGSVLPGSLSLTEAIVYRQIASELGRLPPQVIKQVVAFYSLIIDVTRSAEAAPTAIEAYNSIYSTLPRIRTHASILIRTLEKFEAADFAPDADMSPKPDEIRRFAADAGYPLDEIARERGITLPS
jgi:hypothetical protein